MKLKELFAALLLIVILASCGEDEPQLTLEIPGEYTSADFDTHVTAEATVMAELTTMTSAANAAEAGAQSETIPAIPYPGTLSSVTEPAYRGYIEGWLVELVAAANSATGFQNPGSGTPATGEEGGLLGSRLLDEHGLELEQMVQKGSFGAALYNHAISVIDGDLSDAAAIDKLVLIHGTNPAFDPSATTAAATYSRRRSNQTTQTGFFYDIKNALIIAKAAIEGGSAFNTQRDEALEDYLLAWEKSNFATVIYYCNSAKTKLQAAGDDADALGSAMHSYAEGVGFAHGFRGLSRKLITDAQIDGILDLLLAPAGQTPESYRFLNDATLLSNLDQVISDLQAIYGFSDEEISSFYVNDPT